MVKAVARATAVAVALAGLVLAGCSDGSTADAPLPSPEVASSPSPRATSPSAPVTDLDCRDAIATATQMSEYDTEVLGAVALPSRRAFGPESLVNGFVKHGLLVHPGVTVELAVPPDLASHVTIAWGTPGTSTTHLRIPGCTTTMSTSPSKSVMSTDGDAWLVFSGGYTVDAPVCLPLLVRQGGVEQTVRIGLGVTCPGQEPPAPVDTDPPA